VQQAFYTVSSHHGLGKYDLSLTQDELILVRKWRCLSIPPAIVVCILARISNCILLVRLFGVYTWFKWFLIVVTTTSSIFGTLTIPLIFLQYTSVEALWNPYIGYYQRWDPMIESILEYLTQCKLATTQTVASIPQKILF
jgi:hypothetical protein